MTMFTLWTSQPIFYQMTCKNFEYKPFIEFILKHPTAASLTWSSMRNGLRSELRRNILDKVKNSKDNKVKSIDFGWFSKRFLKLVTPAWCSLKIWINFANHCEESIRNIMMWFNRPNRKKRRKCFKSLNRLRIWSFLCILWARFLTGITFFLTDNSQ